MGIAPAKLPSTSVDSESGFLDPKCVSQKKEINPKPSIIMETVYSTLYTHARQTGNQEGFVFTFL